MAVKRSNVEGSAVRCGRWLRALTLYTAKPWLRHGAGAGAIVARSASRRRSPR